MVLELIITGAVIVCAVLFLVWQYYRVFSGKRSACSCGTEKYAIKNGNLQGCSSCGGCSCCRKPKNGAK